MKKTISTVVLCGLTALSGVAVAGDPAVEGFLLSQNSMMPANGLYTTLYKNFIEAKCDRALTAQELMSDDFQNVVMALMISEQMEEMDREKTGLYEDVGKRIGVKSSCSDFSLPFNELVNDPYIKNTYPRYSQFLYSWDQVSKEQAQVSVK